MTNFNMPNSVHAALVKAVEWLEKVEDAEARAAGTGCDEGCSGWGLFEVNRGTGLELERCDNCDQYPTDEDAVRHVMTRLGEEMSRKHQDLIDQEEKEQEALDSMSDPSPQDITPMFISDNEVGFDLIYDSGDTFKIPRYGVWGRRDGGGKTEVVEVSDDLVGLKRKWGNLPIYKTKPAPSPDAGKSKEVMKHLDREAGD